MYCRQCGRDIPDDSDFCQACGAYVQHTYADEPRTEDVYVRSGHGIEPQKRTFALLLAVVPGFIDVFGLGHIYLGKYLKGAAFLLISVILLATRTLIDISAWELYFTIGTLALFVVQVADIFRIAYN